MAKHRFKRIPEDACPICWAEGFVAIRYWDTDRRELVCPEERDHKA